MAMPRLLNGYYGLEREGAFGHNFNSSQNIESVGRNDVNAPFLPPTLNILSENIIHSQMADLQNCLYHTGTNSLC